MSKIATPTITSVTVIPTPEVSQYRNVLTPEVSGETVNRVWDNHATASENDATFTAGAKYIRKHYTAAFTDTLRERATVGATVRKYRDFDRVQTISRSGVGYVSARVDGKVKSVPLAGDEFLAMRAAKAAKRTNKLARLMEAWGDDD